MADLRPTACRTKNHYPTRQIAEAARSRLQNEHGWVLHSYQCPDCTQWHVARTKHEGQYIVYLGRQ